MSPMTKKSNASPPCILWFRDDLRLADNPALNAAVDAALSLGGGVLCLFIHDEHSLGLRKLGAAAKWWLGRSLAALDDSLRAKGSGLVVMAGAAEEVLSRCIAETGATALFWNRRYGGAERACDSAIKSGLRAKDIRIESFNSHLLNEPWEVTTQAGTPVKVFTPYWKAARARGEPAAPLPAPDRIPAFTVPDRLRPLALPLAGFGFEPAHPDWASGLRAEWQPGEAGAADRLGTFLDTALDGYGVNRNRPDYVSSSRLSPHLRFGEISPRQVWHVARSAVMSGAAKAPVADLDKFLSEVGWREFAFHLLYHNPNLASENYNPRFDSFEWQHDEALLEAWQKGQTGYPLVDAGMRELWTTGWMHNRVRMVVASFLIKHLMIDWRVGERWFWDTLVDACPANNAASWQWVAGSGADAAPYFRIFNPFGQGEKFDTGGVYVRKWIPELAKLPNNLIHRPWQAPQGLLLAAGVTLGSDYPHPVVDHDRARERALSSYNSTKPNAA